MWKVFLGALALLFGSVAFGQSSPKVELSVDYSYMRFNPENQSIVKAFSLNGGGGGGAFYFNGWIGIEGEFQGYASTTRTFVFPAGTTACPGAVNCTANVQANLFTYNIGPIFKYRASHFEPFAEVMFGGAHSNTYGRVFQSCVGCVFAKSPSNNAFDFIIGGGIDVPINHHIAVRPAQFDYVLTRFDTGFTSGNNNQSNFRYQAGLVFRF